MAKLDVTSRIAEIVWMVLGSLETTSRATDITDSLSLSLSLHRDRTSVPSQPVVNKRRFKFDETIGLSAPVLSSS